MSTLPEINGTLPTDTVNGSTRAVFYLRVSTKEQAEKGGEVEGYSIPAQRDACKRKAVSLGATAIEEFVDRGESARNADRPELQRMLAYLVANPVDFVVCHKVDRLARNRADDVEITLAIRAAGAALVSCSENIDETPSGLLLHGIMSSIAEFYSRNLASEVIKGSVQKAKAGGTPGKAPLGYLNIRTEENGREVRDITIDPVRGPLMRWAFETYANGGWSLLRLRDELTRQGLETTPSPKRPSRSLYLSHLHKLLRHPYYKGTVRYRGVEYAGRHEPLVSAETWQQVQDLLTAHHRAGERQRDHNHFLKGSVFCGGCGSRLIITNARSRSGRIYPYFVCSGRHTKRTDCTFKAILIQTVEEKVEEHYSTVQLGPTLRDSIKRLLTSELHAFHKEKEAEHATLEKRQQRLLTERAKLLQAHYAEAVPIDLLKTEQDRIRGQLSHIRERLAATDSRHALIETNLHQALDLTANTRAAYVTAPHKVRRQFNQVFFTRLYIEDDNSVRSDLAQPFDILLSDELGSLAKKLPSDPAPAETDWSVWEAPFNKDAHKGLPPVGVGQARRPQRGRGLTNEVLVAPGGIEPPRVDSKSTALSTELRGRAISPGRLKGGGRDLNPRPPGSQPGALPTELPPPRSHDRIPSMA